MAPAEDPGAKYEVRHQIGRGSFGSAFLVTNKQDKADYVLKRVRLAKQTKWQRSSTLQERDLATSLRHPFIVPCVESWVIHNHTVNMIYAFCQNGDLSSYLARIKKQGAQVEEALMQRWLCQLLLALDYLQTQHVLHRDIKSSNLMLTSDNDIQLGDFGLATLMEEVGDETRPQDTNLVGTPHYMSPELLSCKAYGFKTDVWSLGCVFYELTAQRPTFEAFNIHGLVSKIKKNKLTPLPSSYSTEWRDMVALMLCKNPDRRPSVQQLMALPALRPAMLEARARAQQLMPEVPLPPLLDPTPLTPQPLTGQYRMSEGQDVADESEGSVGCMSDQHGCCRSGGVGSEAGSSRTSCKAGDRRYAATGLAAVQAVQASELSELWKANFGSLQQQEQRDTESSEQQQCAADVQQEQQHGSSSSPEPVLEPTCSSGSQDAASTGGCSPAGSHSSSPNVIPGQSSAGSRGLCAGYSPRGACNIIGGYKRLVTPRTQQQQHVHQPGIRRTPSERVAAAIAAAGAGQPGAGTTAAAGGGAAAKGTGRLTPDLCRRPLSGLSPAGSRAPGSSSSSSSSSKRSVTAQQQHDGSDGSASAAPVQATGCSSKQPPPAAASTVAPRPVSKAAGSQRPFTDGGRPHAGGARAQQEQQHAAAAGLSELPTAATVGAAAAAAPTRPLPRPLSAPRSTSASRMSDRGPSSAGGSGKQQPQRPPWGGGAGGGACRSCLTPGRQRPDQSPLVKALKAQNAAAAAAAAMAAAGPELPAGMLVRKQRRSHGQLSPVPSHEMPGQAISCAATSSECVAQNGPPAGQQQQMLSPQQGQPRQAAKTAAGSGSEPAGKAPEQHAAGVAALVQPSVSAVHGLPRRASYQSPASNSMQQLGPEALVPQDGATGSASKQRTSAPDGLPPLPLHKLQRVESPAGLSPLPLASPVHSKDGPSTGHASSSTAGQHAQQDSRHDPLSKTAGVPAASGSSPERSTPCLRQPQQPLLRPGAACVKDSQQQQEASSGPAADGAHVQQAHAARAAECKSARSRAAGDAKVQRGKPVSSQVATRTSTGGSNRGGNSSRRASSTTSRRCSSGSIGAPMRSTSTSRRSSEDDAKQPRQSQGVNSTAAAAGATLAADVAVKQCNSQPAYRCPTPKHGKQREQQQQWQQQQQQQQQRAGDPYQQQQVAQRLELLEAAMMVVGGLVERKRWTELRTVVRSAGLLPSGLYPGMEATTGREGAEAVKAHQQQQQPCAADVLKLGDIVVLGSSRSIRGQIRYIGPVAWDPTAADWVGMELDRPCGVDATQRGLTYFECPPHCASFHRASDLTSLG